MFVYHSALQPRASPPFSLSYARVRAHSESIAFFGGALRELAVAKTHFRRVMRVARKKAHMDFYFNLVKAIVVKMVPAVW